jgi:hypothetical protein
MLTVAARALPAWLTATEAHMRKLIAVALLSAGIGAGVTLWAKSSVPATGAPVDPSSVRVSPHEIMRSSGNLPVEAVVDPM